VAFLRGGDPSCKQQAETERQGFAHEGFDGSQGPARQYLPADEA
jgi:hypothetical protein